MNNNNYRIYISYNASIFFLFFLIPLKIWSLDTISIKEDFSDVLLGEYVEYFVIKESPHSIKEIIEDEETIIFQKNQRNDVNFGAVSHPFLFKFNLNNETRLEQHVVFEIQNPIINKTQLFLKSRDSLIIIPQIGDLFSFSSRPIESRHFAFPIKLPPGEKITCFFTIDKSGESLMTFIRLFSQREFRKKESLESLVIGGVIGFSTLLIVLAFLAAITLKDKYYWLYFTYLIFLLLSLICGSGYGYQFIFREYPDLTQVLGLQFLGISILIFTIFVRIILQEQMNISKWNPVFFTYFAITFICLLAGFYYPKSRVYKYSVVILYVGYFVSIFTFFIASYLTFKLFLHDRKFESFIIFIAMSYILLTILLMTLTARGFLPLTIYTSEYIGFWVFFESLFITILMFLRVYQTYKERIDLKKSLYEEKKKVGTQFFKGQLKERERLSQDLHDGINLNMITIKTKLSLLNLKNTKDYPSKELTELIKLVGRTTEDIRNFSHALGSVTLQKFGLKAAIEDLITILQSSKPSLEINSDTELLIEKSYPKDIESFIFYIIQELLNNIIKHARASKILVRLEEVDNSIHLTVLDNGIGYNPEQIKSGIGIQNIHSRVFMGDGSFEIKKNTPNGMKHLVSFPISTPN